MKTSIICANTFLGCYFERDVHLESQKLKKSMARLFFLSVILLLIQPGEAQKKNVDLNEYVPTPLLWYEEPWVWIIAACFFLIVLVILLFRGNTK